MFWQTVRSMRLGVGFIALLLLSPPMTQAQQPIVYGIFFYLPTCSHCHEVITNHWPGIQDEFGDQLKVLFVDVSTYQGSQVMGTAIEAMHIPSNGVPMLIIGTDVLVGSIDIPQRAPGLIRAGINSGGVGYPPILGIDAVFQSALSEDAAAPAEVERRSLLDDPSNLAALIVLLGLGGGIGSMGAVSWTLLTRRNRRLMNTINGLFGCRMAWIGTLVGISLAGSLVIGSFEDPITLLISSAILAVFVMLAIHLFRSASPTDAPNWLIPLILGSGLLVAGYLAIVEITLVEATCGALGDCNTVQHSPYARIFGIPAGIIGILGYLAILSLWLVNRLKNRRWIDAVLFAMTLLGVAFSTYLTFLEPFVIGTSCVWCLISAVVMGILLWLSAPAGWNAMNAMRGGNGGSPV